MQCTQRHSRQVGEVPSVPIDWFTRGLKPNRLPNLFRTMDFGGFGWGKSRAETISDRTSKYEIPKYFMFRPEPWLQPPPESVGPALVGCTLGVSPTPRAGLELGLLDRSWGHS
jgi:hypothetical protein